QERETTAVSDLTEEEVAELKEEEEEEVPESSIYVTKEKEDEKAYADELWIQVHSSQSS
ncbi:hypothetical protein MIMGU_mgv1a0009321mg, partial [Erythranthe guttata]